MKYLTISIILSSILFLVSCNEETASAVSADGYPLTKCVISGEDLGSMGEPFVYNHEGTVVKFCCEPCVEDFKEAPDKYLAQLAAAKDLAE